MEDASSVSWRSCALVFRLSHRSPCPCLNSIRAAWRHVLSLSCRDFGKTWITVQQMLKLQLALLNKTAITWNDTLMYTVLTLTNVPWLPLFWVSILKVDCPSRASGDVIPSFLFFLIVFSTFFLDFREPLWHYLESVTVKVSPFESLPSPDHNTPLQSCTIGR